MPHSEVFAPWATESLELNPTEVIGELTVSPAAKAVENYLDIGKLSSLPGTKPHHITTLHAVRRNLINGRMRGYVESATSTGKTFYIAKLTEAFDKAGLRTLILTHSLDQAEQVIGLNQKRGLGRFTAINAAKIGKHYGGDKASKQHSVVVSTYAGMNSFALSGDLGAFDVILADEAHRSLGPITGKRLDEFSPGAVKIGFTATPDYAVDRKAEQIFARPFHRLKLREAIEESIVAPIQALIYRTDQEIPMLDNREEFSDQELERLVHIKARNEKVIEVAKGLVGDRRQGIIACLPGGNLLHARMLAERMNGTTISRPDGGKKILTSVAVGSHESPNLRREKLEAYERGEIDVLTFVNSIAEGWDSEKASFLINACPTTSIVKITQLIGRVLRVKPDGKESVVIDFIDNSLKQQATALAALDEERISLSRVLGNYRTSNDDGTSRHSYLEKILGSEIYENIAASDAQLLSELHLKLSSQDPVARLIAEFDAELSAQGMPAEPIDELKIPRATINGLKAFIRRYRRQNNTEPSLSELEYFIDSAGYRVARPDDVGVRQLAQLALDGFRVDSYGLAPKDGRVLYTEPADVEAESEHNLRNESIRSALGELTEREKNIVIKRFGLDDGHEWTRDRLGREFNVTPERISQIERASFKKFGAGILSRDGFKYLRSTYDLGPQRVDEFIARRLEDIDHRLYIAKMHAIRLTYVQKEHRADLPTKDEVICQYNLYAFIKNLYSFHPEGIARLETWESGSQDTKSSFIEDKINIWLPLYQTAEQKGKLLKEMSAYMVYRIPTMGSPRIFNMWLRTAIVASRNKVKSGVYW